jgi:hypothetical protein
VVPCRGIRAQGYLALGLDCGSEGGVVFFHMDFFMYCCFRPPWGYMCTGSLWTLLFSFS